jgi:uncharacterized HAD superfamily protein
MKPVLCCDLDSVLADTDGAAIYRMNRDFGTSFHPADQVQWSLEGNLAGVCDDPATYITGMFCDPAFYADLPLILPMLVVLRKIKQHFREVQILTSRPEQVRSATRAWLDEYGIPYDRLVMTQDKARYCFEVGAAYHIEDAPHHALAVAERGIGVFLIDKPYNRTMEPRGGLWRITHPMDIVTILRADLTRSTGSTTPGAAARPGGAGSGSGSSAPTGEPRRS